MDDKSIIILLAEDDPEDMELIADALMLVEPTAELHKFTDGFSAYEYLRTSPDKSLPSLIILDYNMPKLTGAQVLKNISSVMRYGAIPKVILSTSNSPVHKHECMQNGALQYFVKPASLKELNKMAKTILSLHV